MKYYFVYVAYNPIGKDNEPNSSETRTYSGIVEAYQAQEAAKKFLKQSEITNDQVESLSASRVWSN